MTVSDQLISVMVISLMADTTLLEWRLLNKFILLLALLSGGCQEGHLAFYSDTPATLKASKDH